MAAMRAAAAHLALVAFRGEVAEGGKEVGRRGDTHAGREFVQDGQRLTARGAHGQVHGVVLQQVAQRGRHPASGGPGRVSVRGVRTGARAGTHCAASICACEAGMSVRRSDHASTAATTSALGSLVRNSCCSTWCCQQEHGVGGQPAGRRAGGGKGLFGTFIWRAES